ncbi:hypothetical protein [Turicibacter sanguinis]|uniref:hypothetical protein n=1 Tax=Turicibacter sanguinis TaxID=154288 RepID=UPI00189CF889|nr:hypothetical protein [Turicibacter sanguinis]
MLNRIKFANMIKYYCEGEILKYLDFWRAYRFMDEIDPYIKCNIYAQSREYLIIENHKIEMDFFNNMHQFLIIEFTSDSVVELLKQNLNDWYCYELTEDDIESIKLGLDNSYCQMKYYWISYYYYNEFGYPDYYHENSLCLDDPIIFTDKEYAVKYLYANYIEDDWIVDADLDWEII